MYIPDECIGFHKKWLKDGHEEETIEDLDIMDIIKALIGFHHEMIDGVADDENILLLFDKLNENTRHGQCQHRLNQIELAKNLVKTNKLSMTDAIFLLFSKEDLVS
jgi:hypothetical protein